MMFRSIKVNIILLCVGIMVILAIGMGSVSLLSISKLTEQHEAENMNRIAEQKREPINTQLIQTEIVVNFVANAINRMVENSIAIQDDGIWDGFSRSSTGKRNLRSGIYSNVTNDSIFYTVVDSFNIDCF
ncbi:MAG: hypothetical protein SPK53_03235 [Selenomonas sp.]|nr:hypothetical protein [Selenomonadales bacterium]MDD7762332.1 hypothetical protein [Selenomonadales bacterium]MDY5716762.1 hypothetical protein [Selenomonas sp.]